MGDAWLGALALLAAFAIALSAFGAAQEHPVLRADAKIVDEQYCYGDLELFTVSLRLDVKVTNRSQESIYFMSGMIPYVARYATSLADAQKGKYLRDETRSHVFPGAEKRRGRLVQVKPGESVVLHTGYDVIARYQSAPVVAGYLPPGTYALQLVLRPELEPPTDVQDLNLQESITTDPFVFTVPRHPAVTNCHVTSSGP